MLHPCHFSLGDFFTAEVFICSIKATPRQPPLLYFILGPAARWMDPSNLLEESWILPFFGVLLVSHEEGVVLLFLQASVALVAGLAHKYTAAESLAGLIHRQLQIFLSFFSVNRLFVKDNLYHYQSLPMLVIHF